MSHSHLFLKKISPESACVLHILQSFLDKSCDFAALISQLAETTPLEDNDRQNQVAPLIVLLETLIVLKSNQIMGA